MDIGYAIAFVAGAISSLVAILVWTGAAAAGRADRMYEELAAKQAEKRERER